VSGVTRIEPRDRGKGIGEDGHRLGVPWRDYELRVESEPAAIGVTREHPFWSVDRNAWTLACALRAGERLQAQDGRTPRVLSFEPREGVEPVYNIEVEGDHCYRVGEQGLLVHNASAKDSDECPCPKSPKDATKPLLDGRDRRRIEDGCLLDLTDYVNGSGIQLRIDPDFVSPEDAKGRSNRIRAKEGIASILQNGDGVQLHYRDQTFFSVLDETSAKFHRSVLKDPDFHPFANDPGYLSWRGEVAVYGGAIKTLGAIFDSIRGKYWRSRI
jgi:hypothetical protein